MNFITPSLSNAPISIIDTTKKNTAKHTQGRIYSCNVQLANGTPGFGFFEVRRTRGGKIVALALRGGKHYVRLNDAPGYQFSGVARQLRDWVCGLSDLRIEDYIVISRMIEAFIASRSNSPVSNFCTARNAAGGQGK